MNRWFLPIDLAFMFLLWAFAPVDAQTPDYDRMQYQIAQRYESIGDFRNALEVYKRLFQKSPQNFTYFDAVSRCYINLKDFDTLIDFINSNLKAEPNNWQYQVKLGDAYLHKGEKEQAEQIWSNLLQQRSKDISLYRMIANSYLQNRQFDKAIEIYQTGRAAFENESLFSLELAQLHTYRLNYESATEEYLRFLRQNPNQLVYVEGRLADFKGDFQTYQQVSTVLQNSIRKEPEILAYRNLYISFLVSFQNYEEAFCQVKQFEELAKQQTGQTRPGFEMFRFGQTVIAEEQYNLAEKAFSFLLKNYPEFPDRGHVEYELARTLFLQDKINDALAMFDQVAKKFPQTNWSLEAYMTRGEIFLNQLFLPDSAAKVFQQVLVVFPNHDSRVLALIDLGDVEVFRDNLNQAGKFYQEALEMVVKNGKLASEIQIKGKLKLAELAFFQQDFDSAKQSLHSILQEQSTNLGNIYINDALELLMLIEKSESENLTVLAEYSKALLLSHQNRTQVAAKKFEEIAAENPNSSLAPKALLESAKLRQKSGDFLSAVLAYQRIFQQYPSSDLCDLSLWNAGRLYEKDVKDVSKAIEFYEKILLNYPESMLAEKARKRIRELEGKS